jgi:hypothetical protein
MLFCGTTDGPFLDVEAGPRLLRCPSCQAARGLGDELLAAYDPGQPYAKAFNGVWVDSRSQSITIESAEVFGWPAHPAVDWGQVEGGNCRVKAPNGSTGCSVANAVAVDFYGPGIAVAGRGDPFDNSVFSVSWRDDRGVPHRFVPVQVGPDDDPLRSPTWHA